MEVKITDFKIEIDNKQISDFSIKKIDNFLYEISNDRMTTNIELKKISATLFSSKLTIAGPFNFIGSNKQLNCIIKHISNE